MATSAAPIGTFQKFVQFSKLEDGKDKDAQPTVWGVSTWEKPDCDEEICDYDTAVPVYQAWSKKAFDRTSRAGQEPSLGNIRLQHGLDIGGKVTKMEFNDGAKEIWLGAEPLNDEIKRQLKEGFFTGYSQGGSYAWRACESCESPMTLRQGDNFCDKCGKLVRVRYGLKRLSEVSFVDSPAIGEGFEHVKANGSREILKFQKKEKDTVAKTKTVAGVALPAHCFAYVGDPEKTETWKLPIEFPGDEKKTKSHIRNALARFDQTQGIPDGEKSKVKAKIEAAARSHGIDVGEDQGKADRFRNMFKAAVILKAKASGISDDVVKGLWDVSRFAEILMQMANVWESAVWEREIEGDESAVPDDLKELLDSMVDAFLAMATEEARELSARTTKSTGATMTPEELLKQAQDLDKAAKKSLATHFAKAASHHERMADHEEKAAAHHEKAMNRCEECMGKAETAKAARIEALKKENETAKAAAEAKGEAFVAKEDVGSGADHGDIHEVLANQQTFHKAMVGVHMKKATAHDKHAEHLHAMAEGCDAETGKAVRAELTKAYEDEVKAEKDATPPAPAKPAVPTMEEDVIKAAAAIRETPEYKEALARIAKAKVDAEVKALEQSTLAPLGIKIGQDAGQAILKDGVRLVPRDPAEKLVLTPSSGVNELPGM